MYCKNGIKLRSLLEESKVEVNKALKKIYIFSEKFRRICIFSFYLM